MTLRALAPIALASMGCIAAPESEELVDDRELAVGHAPDGGYTFGASGDERLGWVPVHESGGKWHVVYSVPLKNLMPDERVAVRGEVQLTTCQASDLPDTPCQRITPFDPKFKVKIVLGTSPDDAEGKDLSQTRDITCTHFKHHCAVAIDEKVSSDSSGDEFANLVVSAVGGPASGKDRMIVDADHGGLYVTRIGKGAKAQGKPFEGKDVSPAWMKLDMANAHPRKPHVVLQAKLNGTLPGDILDIDALIVAKTRGSGPKPAGCQGARDPLITHKVYVSKHEDDPIKSKIGGVTAKNGINCKIDDTCDYHKSGAIRLPDDVPDTVYVSVVSWGGRSCSAPSDEWSLGNASRLEVGRLR